MKVIIIFKHYYFFKIIKATRCQANEDNFLQQRLEIPNVPTHFIYCRGRSDFTIQTCPEPHLFNKYLDRCDIDQDPILTGCASSPCQFGAKCRELPNLDYQCECAAGFHGKNCQQAPDVCATMPCGHEDTNVCHAQPAETGLAYYCTCHGGKAFGLSCDEGRVERNPCDDGVERGRVFSTRIGESVFALCDDEHRLGLKVCDRKMQALGKCNWLNELGNNNINRVRRVAKRRNFSKRNHH